MDNIADPLAKGLSREELHSELLCVQNGVDVNEISRLNVRHSVPCLTRNYVYFLSHIGEMSKLVRTLLCINRCPNSIALTHIKSISIIDFQHMEYASEKMKFQAVLFSPTIQLTVSAVVPWETDSESVLREACQTRASSL
ncbi:hypothetical protein Tco_1427931 [Tanacetum coccineum]